MGCEPTNWSSGCAEFDRLDSLFGWLIKDLADLDDGVWVGRKGIRPATVFSDEQQVGINDLADSSWWYQVRNDLLIRYLRRNGSSGAIWDIGSGTGIVSQALRDAGFQVVAIEPAGGGAISAAARGLPSVASTFEDLRLPARSISATGLFDVVEHLTEPEALLAECRRVLAPSGQLYVTVPAHPWLWSQADTLAQHHRRYTRKSLRTLLENSGFTIHDCSYRLATLVAPMALARSIPWRLGYRPESTSFQRQLDKQLGYSSAMLTRCLIGLESLVGGASPIGTSLFACASPRSVAHS